jgi:beta-fructofuranosidase
VVHYRISDSVNGPFVKPERDTVDGNGFYAGRLETDGEHLYVVGWNGTKFDHEDENDYDWAGNMVVHQLEQQPDGTLRPVPNEKVVAAMSHALTLEPVLMTDTVTAEENSFRLKGDQYELVQFQALDGTTRLEADVSGWGEEDLFGLAFAPDTENVGAMNYVFHPKENRVEFFNTDNIVEMDAQSFIDFDFSGRDSIHITLLIGDGVATLYLDNEAALTARMYRSQGTNWQIFGVNAGVKWDNVAIFA